MPASTHTADHRPLPSVAIIGNDAVLAAVPATPVQLAHACLRRGFTVAVPASWGDELVAAESVRRLASREKGPAVMCVCPFVRSRLLAPGPDLAPFLVQLVSPPIATARYLRTVYGEHGVHITYVGGCPSGEDPVIDARLTPDAFFADLAEHGVALSEQPLVFDSIVPPDRRRWCSLPGGAPSAEVLWSDTDTRTLIEIDRDEVSTDLAQHIIAREHVLIDLAPSLGCVCSGAISSIPPRSARVAVTALEPPRALGPILDPAAIVSLEVPVVELASRRTDHVAARSEAPPEEDAPSAAPAALMVDRDSYLDALLGTPVDAPPTYAGIEDGLDAPDVDASTDDSTTVEEPLASDPATIAVIIESDDTTLDDLEPLAEENAVAAHADVLVVIESGAAEVQSIVVDAILPPAFDGSIEDVGLSHVRRRTPPAMPVRHLTSAVPKTVTGQGRPLPRAYVAKRRTPPSGAAVIATRADAKPAEPAVDAPSIESSRPVGVAPDSTTPTPAGGGSATSNIDVAPDMIPEPEPNQPGPSVIVSSPANSSNAASPAPRAPFSSPVMGKPGPINFPLLIPRPSDTDAGGGSVAAPAASRSALIFLLVAALLALGISALFLLRG